AGIEDSAGHSTDLFASGAVSSSPLSFDGTTGQLVIQAPAGQHTVRETVAADGFVNVTLDGHMHSSNPGSAAFDRGLAGATNVTVHGIRYAGAGQDTLILGTQQLPGGLTIQATGATVRTEEVNTAGPLAIQAPNITVRGMVRGSSVSLAAPG